MSGPAKQDHYGSERGGQERFEDHSPMWVHWRHRRMKFTHKGRRITLNGIQDNPSCRPISVRKLQGLLKRGAVSQCVQVRQIHQEHDLQAITLDADPAEQTPPAVQELLQEFDALFREPKELPPRRACDHQIPLMPGAVPVNVRPYRYAPHQKTEIEKQICEMMNNGIIRRSTSPFASPVLLVRKKDGSWRF